MRMQHITMVAYRRFKLLRHCFLGSNTREVVTSSKQNYFYNSCELFIYLFAHNFQNLNVFEMNFLIKNTKTYFDFILFVII